MEPNTLLYRGTLKSCNYHCSYCPFSKRPQSERELKRDKEQWEDFYPRLIRTASSRNIRAIMLTPYGEALIHPWYWEGLAALSQSPDLDCVGAQSNFSFSLETLVRRFCQAGGRLSKLRIWATFHPEMISAEAFAAKCQESGEAGLVLCVGVVGVPENLDVIRRLRALLPQEIYLWVNGMDGRKRPYTEEEIAAFSEIDPYFYRELHGVPADPSLCRGRLFAEGDGKIHPCNINHISTENWHDWPKDEGPVPKCSRKVCSCYLAYGGRSDWMNQILFGPYPLFRIPRRPKAVFLDIEGTLISGENAVLPEIYQGLRVLREREHARLFFATTLPYPEAMERCREIRHLFCGGVFAGGAHIRVDPFPNGQEIQGCGFQQFYPIPEEILPVLEEQKGGVRFHILTYRKSGEGRELYKISLLRPRQRPWKEVEAEALFQSLLCAVFWPDTNVFQPAEHRQPASSPPAVCLEKRTQSAPIRYFLEDHCMEIVAREANKANGVQEICRQLSISLEHGAAAGNGAEDVRMIALINEIR